MPFLLLKRTLTLSIKTFFVGLSTIPPDGLEVISPAEISTTLEPIPIPSPKASPTVISRNITLLQLNILKM